MKRRKSEQLELLQTVGVCMCGHESCNHIGVFPHRQCIEDACDCRSYVAAGSLTRPPAAHGLTLAEWLATLSEGERARIMATFPPEMAPLLDHPVPLALVRGGKP